MMGECIGLQTRIREEHTPDLVKIGGDSIHVIHNASKKLTDPFEDGVIGLFNNLYTDFKHNSYNTAMFQKICVFLGLPSTTVGRFVSNRWLCAYDQAVSTLLLWDALVIFYFAYVPRNQQQKYEGEVFNIIKDVPAVRVEQIDLFREELKKQWKDSKLPTQTRKNKIVASLFENRFSTNLQLDFIVITMEPMKNFCKEFQSRKVGIHKLYEKQINLVKKQMTRFVKAEVVVTMKKPGDLKKFKAKDNDLIPLEDMTVVKASTRARCGPDSEVYRSFAITARGALKTSTLQLINKLSFDKDILQYLSALCPKQHPSSESTAKLKKLPLYFKVLTHEETDEYDEELLRFSLADLPPTSTPDGALVTPDEWWGQLFKTGNYPIMLKVFTPALSMFVGPVVEGLFSEIQNQVTDKRNPLKVSTVSATQSVRWGLRNDGQPEYLWPIGQNAKPSLKQSAVHAVQGAYQTSKQSLSKQRKEEEEEDKLYGVTRVTKKSALKELRASFKRPEIN